MNFPATNGWSTPAIFRRLSPGHKVLACLFAVTTFIIAFDGLVESGNLATWIGKDSRLGQALMGLADYHEDEAPELEARWTTIPIDHGDPSGPTFRNRYWMNDAYYKPGGPVFVYDSGEGDASGAVERFLQRPNSFMGALMQEFRGLGILWEHRYYGESLPFPVTNTTTAEHFQFLTLNQSLADLPYFANRLHLDSWSQADLKPSATPWIMLGCSYSGTRSALSRLAHPETFFAVYAGEAPVLFNATVNQHWDPLYQSLIDHGRENCAKNLHSMVEYIDSQLSDPETALSLKQQFFGHEAGKFSNRDFATAIGSFYSNFKGWGINQGTPSIAALCDYLETDPISNQTADFNGAPVSYNPQYLTTRLASWSEFMPHIHKFYHSNCTINNVNQDNCTLRATYSNPGWLWQQCSELGLFIVPGKHHLFPQTGVWGSQVSDCQRWFPTVPGNELRDVIARTSVTNREWGGLKMRPSNTFWSGGQYDVWRSVTPLAPDELGSVRVTRDIPACNVATNSDTVFGVLLPEAGHCAVVGKNTTDVFAARRLFADALHEWLKCF